MKEKQGEGEVPLSTCNTSNMRAKRLRMRKVSIFKIAVANANFTARTPFFFFFLI